MKSSTAEIVALWPTLLSCYRPVERYRQLTATFADPAPAVEFKALDAFLLWQLAAALPTAPPVIDAAADETGGATAAFWLAAPVIEQCFLLPGDAPWRTRFAQTAAEIGANRNWIVGDEATIAAQLSPRSQPLITLACRETEADRLTAQLGHWLKLFPDGWILLWPLGGIGSSALLAAALDFCRAQPRYRLTALREVSPFLASSTLGAIHPAESAAMSAAFTRLQQMYDGNHQFLTLARTVNELAVQLERTVNEREQAAARFEQTAREAEQAAQAAAERYRAETERHKAEAEHAMERQRAEAEQAAQAAAERHRAEMEWQRAELQAQITWMRDELNAAPTFGKLRYETKRWLWQSVLPRRLKRLLGG